MSDTKSWLVHHIFRTELKKTAKQYATGRLIDIGCGTKPYKKLFAQYVSEHIGMDHADCVHNKSDINIFGTAYSIPVEDGSFDTALSTSVLEHLEEPSEALKEANRVLKNGGVLICSAPLFWPLHEEPRDFFRYTKYGLKYLLEKNGFKVIELKELSGFWVTFGQQFVNYMWRYNHSLLKLFIYPFGMLIQLICLLLNKIDKSKQFTWMYLLVAKKK